MAGLDLQPALDKMYKDMLRTHRERENELLEEVDVERRSKVVIFFSAIRIRTNSLFELVRIYP